MGEREGERERTRKGNMKKGILISLIKLYILDQKGNRFKVSFSKETNRSPLLIFICSFVYFFAAKLHLMSAKYYMVLMLFSPY